MSDFALPLTTSSYSTGVLQQLRGHAEDLARGLDPATTAPTGVPTNAVRWNSASTKWQKFDGTSWVDLAATYTINVSHLGGDAAALFARLASPTFTGTPSAPTAAADTNTTQIATTAYVINQGYLKSSAAASTYAPLANPTLTGTVTIPTPPVDTNSTRAASTAYVLGQLSSSNPLVNGIAAPGTSLRMARADHVHPGGAGSGLDADLLDGLNASATRVANTIVARGAFGEIRGQDFYASRGDGTGVIFLNEAGTRYLYFNGTTYDMPGAPLFVNGSQVLHNVIANTGLGESPIHALSGGVATWKKFRGSSNIDIVVQADGNLQWVYLPGGGGSNDSLHPHSDIEIPAHSETRANRRWYKQLIDIRPGDKVVGGDGEIDEVIGIKFGERGDIPFAQLNGKYVLTPGHLIPLEGGGWCAVDPDCYAKCSYDKQKTVKAKRGTVTVLSAICEPKLITKLAVGMRVMVEGGVFEAVEKIELLDNFSVHQPTMSVLLKRQKVLFCDGLAVATLA